MPKNKDEIDSQTTHKLNKQYHIKGYVITKIKGELCLKKPYYPKGSKDSPEGESWTKKNNNQSSDDLLVRVKRLEETVNKIIDLLQPQ